MEQVSLDKLNMEVMALKKQMNEIQKFINEDLEFARRTEEAWQEIDEGKCRTFSKEDFLKEMEKW
jgi:hypothetical protein